MAENWSPLPSMRGNEINAGLMNSADDAAHNEPSGAEAPHTRQPNIAAEAATHKAQYYIID
jgi:hypothetical protein